MLKSVVKLIISILIDIFRLMIYDHETGIAHKSASNYFQFRPFYWGAVLIFSTTTHRGVVQKDGAEMVSVQIDRATKSPAP